MTEITNVGGMDGVASEATLLKLLEAQKQAGRSGAQMERMANAARQNATKSTTMFGKAADLAGKAVTGYASILKNGAGGLSDFTDQMSILPGFLKGMIRYADESTDTFRNITEVGGTFGNNMLELQSAAARSGIAMNDFFDLIGSNSERLRILGGSVTLGTKRFAEVSRGLRQSDLGQRLFELGMTSQTINEGFLTYTEVMARQGRLSNMSNQQLIEGSGQYLHQLNLLSKLTGKSRKELEEQNRNLNANAILQAKMATMGAEERARFQANLQVALDGLPSASEDIIAMAAGLAGTDLEKQLMALGGPHGAAMVRHLQNMENMDTASFVTAMQEAAPGVTEAINEIGAQTLAALEKGGSEIGGAASGIAVDLQTAFKGVNPEEIANELEQTSTLTAAFTKVTEQVQALASFIADEFLTSETFTQLTNLGTSISDAFRTLLGPATTNGSFDNATQVLKENVTALDNFVSTKLIAPLTIEIDKFKTHIQEGGDAGTYIKEKLREAGKSIVDYFLGPMNEDTGIREGGIFQSIKDRLFPDTGESMTDMLLRKLTEAFDAITNSPRFQAIVDQISLKFRELMHELKLAIDDKIGLLSNAALREEGQMLEFERQLLAGDRTGAEAYLAEQQAQMNNRHASKPETRRRIEEITALMDRIPARRIGTLLATGKKTEPEGGLMNIHQGERVLNPQEAAAYNNQSDVVGAINRLNNTTMQLVGLMSQTNRGVRGISNDFLKGALTV